MQIIGISRQKERFQRLNKQRVKSQV